jgi:hypothetical protein
MVNSGSILVNSGSMLVNSGSVGQQSFNSCQWWSIVVQIANGSVQNANGSVEGATNHKEHDCVPYERLPRPSVQFTRVKASSLTLTARVAKRGFCNFWATAESSAEACVRRSEFMVLSICTKDGLKVLVNKSCLFAWLRGP